MEGGVREGMKWCGMGIDTNKGTTSVQKKRTVKRINQMITIVAAELLL